MVLRSQQQLGEAKGVLFPFIYLLQSSRQQKALTSHVASPAQHGDDVCTLLSAPAPAHRDVLHIPWSALELFLRPNHSSSSDHGWSYIVEGDATLAHFLGQVLRHALHTSFKICQ